VVSYYHLPNGTGIAPVFLMDFQQFLFAVDIWLIKGIHGAALLW
jgi:hypothetical protein